MLPLTLAASWRRDWRLAREFVGTGLLQLTQDGLTLTGRRSDPVRGVLHIVWRLATWTSVAAFSMALLLTTIGVTWRTREWEWLLAGPFVGLPVLFVLWWLAAAVGKGLLTPHTTVRVRWDQIEHFATDGTWIELRTRSKQGRFTGRMRPRRRTPSTRNLLLNIERGLLPGGLGGPTHRLMRPPWVDRLVLWCLLGGAILAGSRFEERVSLWLLGMGEPTEGPLAGIPPGLSPTQLEALTPGACAGGDPGAPRLRNARDGDALTWTIEGPATGHRLVHLRWAAGTGLMDPLDTAGPAATGQHADFFGTAHTIGLSALVPAAAAALVDDVLGNRDLDAFRTAWCAGLVDRLDHTVAPPPEDAPTLRVHRKGRDLVAEVEGAREGDLLLPVRWHDRPGPELFDLCEVPQEGGELGMLPARPTRTWRRFFLSETDQARVFLIPAEHADTAARLARGGTVQRCLVPDSLLHGGLAHARARTDPEHASLLRDQATAIARAETMVPLGGSTQDVVDAVSERYRTVVRRLGAHGRTTTQQDAINEGFLAAVDWTLLLDHVSMGNSISRLEILRQRLSGADPQEEMGERFLMHLAEAFLARSPPDLDAFGARMDIGETWLDINQGREWTVDGRTVRVPYRRTAETYQVIGRFVLMDVAQRLEDHINDGTLPLSNTPLGYWLRFRLLQHEILLDIEKSSGRKGLEAWVTGDFEYLADRLFKKAHEKLRDEQAALEAARGASYALHTRWSAGGAVRTSALIRDGNEIGWVAQCDQARVDLSYVSVDGAGTHAGALAGDRQLLLATSGSYVTADQRTAGLSVVDGEVRNFLLSPKMDGLVIVRGNGELAMLDMKRGGHLPDHERRIRPLRSLTDLHTLLEWLRRDGASAFQTHLLAHDGVLTIDSSKSSGELRERRLLVQAAYRGHPIVAVVDIPGAHRQSLFEAAVTAYSALRSPEEDGGPGLEVQAIANLDVGSYDILEAWDTRGNSLRTGRVGLSQAMNLLTFRM